MLEEEGIEVYDAFHQQNVRVVAPLMCIIADNPMASQLLNHLTGGVYKYCRFCMVGIPVHIQWVFILFYCLAEFQVGRNIDPCVICARRAQPTALQQIMEI